MAKKNRVSPPLKLMALSMALSFACNSVQSAEVLAKGDRGLSLRSAKVKKLPTQNSAENTDPDLWAMRSADYDEPTFGSEPLAAYHAPEANDVYPSELLYNQDNPSQTRLTTADEPADSVPFSRKGLKLRRKKHPDNRAQIEISGRGDSQVNIYTPDPYPLETIAPEPLSSSLYDPTVPLLPLLDTPAAPPPPVEPLTPTLPLIEPLILPPLHPLEPIPAEKERDGDDAEKSPAVGPAADKYLNVITDNPYDDEDEEEEEQAQTAASQSQEQEKPAAPPPQPPQELTPPKPPQEPTPPQPSAGPALQPDRQNNGGPPREAARNGNDANNSLQSRDLDKEPPRRPQPPAQPSRQEVEDYRQRLEVRLLERYNNLPNYAGNVGRVEVVLSKPIEQSLDGSRLRAEFDQLVYDPWGRRIPKLEEEYFVVTFAAGGARQVRADPSIRVGLDYEKSYSEKMPLNADPFGKVQQSKAFAPEQRPTAQTKKMPDWWRPDFPDLQ